MTVEINKTNASSDLKTHTKIKGDAIDNMGRKDKINIEEIFEYGYRYNDYQKSFKFGGDEIVVYSIEVDKDYIYIVGDHFTLHRI